MKILIVGKNIDHKDSMDYINIVLPIIELGNEVVLYSMIENQSENSFNINHLCNTNYIDLIFFIPISAEIDIKLVSILSRKYKTLAYLYDDTWRISYSKMWIQNVHYIVSSDINWKLNFNGYQNKVIYSPFFVNTSSYKFKPIFEKDIDVSFVGQYHPHREWVINYLINQGINVSVFGRGWSHNSEVSHEKMIEIFNRSKINLNLSNCVNYDIFHLLDFKNNNLISLLKSYKLVLKSLYSDDMKIYEMVKARFFEINACRGFQISFYAQGLEHQFLIGKEIEVFENVRQLVKKVNFYLNNSEIRESVANSGYVRTLKDHDSIKRMHNILVKIQ